MINKHMHSLGHPKESGHTTAGNVEEIPCDTKSNPSGTNVFGGVNIKPQRTLLGKCISAVGSPKQVYRALGMHRGVSNPVKRIWNHSLTTPMEEMSTRHRSRVLSMSMPVAS